MKISIRRIKLLAPIFFWVFQLIVHIIRNIYRLGEMSFGKLLSSVLITYPLDIVTFCVFYFVFAPIFFKRKKTQLYIALSIAYLFAYSIVWAMVYYFLGTEISNLWAIYLSSMGHTFLYGFYGVMIRMGIDWFQQRESRRELEKQNIKTELALLRSQINPHFLFNTLNNIHSFALSEPHKTSWSIIRLSEIMRYMLYETKDERVLLTKEIEYLNNYLELQKIRYNNRDFIDYHVCKIPVNIHVLPMLFIPFVENAFKHGKKSGGAKIIIRMECNENRVYFYCMNQKRDLNETEKGSYAGVGIGNIKRRLELAYPGNHQLEITEDDLSYEVKLIVGTMNFSKSKIR